MVAGVNPLKKKLNTLKPVRTKKNSISEVTLLTLALGLGLGLAPQKTTSVKNLKTSAKAAYHRPLLGKNI